jgi:hypothetical protein
MTVIIVDTLEPVEVDKHHRQAPLMAFRLRQSVAQSVFEECHIRQTCQSVVKSEMP